MLKKVTVAIALTGLMAGAAYAGMQPQTGINGSLHDMNNTPGTHQKDALLRSCVFCHTPHNAQIMMNAPLWNRADSTIPVFAAYGWVAPANMSLNIPDPTVGPTRVCLSCHDGSVAVDSHGTNKPMAGSMKLDPANHAYVRDMTITHPIGFKYADAVAARPGELVPVNTGFLQGNAALLTGQAFDTKNRASVGLSSTKISDTLYQGNVTCASCHEVHNTNNAKPETTGIYNYFLRAQEEGSAICLSCHIK